MPQPYLVPVRPTFSRIAQSSGVSGSTSTLIDFPLIVRFAIAIPWFISSIHRESFGAELGPESRTVQINILRVSHGISAWVPWNNGAWEALRFTLLPRSICPSHGTGVPRRAALSIIDRGLKL